VKSFGKSLWMIYLNQPWDRRVLLASALLAAIPITFSLLRADEPAASALPAAMQVDTHIPKGFVLIPIEVQNYEALDSILGRYGIVDLYQAAGPADGGVQRLVARNVRLLRAPQNPSHFAVLVPETDAHDVLRHGGLFTVTIKRPGRDGTQFVKEEMKPKRSIVYEGG
jgi:hypothetical protein